MSDRVLIIAAPFGYGPAARALLLANALADLAAVTLLSSRDAYRFIAQHRAPPVRCLLKACRLHGIPYSVLPGPSSVLTALVGSGFPPDRFTFGGFLPTKSGQRERELLAANAREETSIYFESPYRLVRTLETCAAHFPERPVCVARELTKQFEEFRCGPAPELLAHFAQKTVKGEIVFLVSGRG